MVAQVMRDSVTRRPWSVVRDVVIRDRWSVVQKYGLSWYCRLTVRKAVVIQNRVRFSFAVIVSGWFRLFAFVWFVCCREGMARYASGTQRKREDKEDSKKSKEWTPSGTENKAGRSQELKRREGRSRVVS